MELNTPAPELSEDELPTVDLSEEFFSNKRFTQDIESTRQEKYLPEKDTYPAGPVQVPPGLTKPGGQYKAHVWLAVLGLAVFLVLYGALTGWLLLTSYRLISNLMENPHDLFMGILTAIPATFLAMFMLKALFFVKRGKTSEDVEITAKEQPRLFEFLHRLADEAGAPRPHRVYVSPRVNAAVFYDLSVLNLLLPSRKNLEIGLALVNQLTLAEFKAVLAHEFGHFAQRSMAVGRWVYMAQQIAGHIIHERDIFDRFLTGLSRTDVRLAWMGWLLSLIVWSIRSLMETLFIGVVLAQRALSREMEFQADLVAVSLTGSEALVNALHRLQAADDGWDRAVNFANAELTRQRKVKNLFVIQSRIIEHLGNIFNQVDYGKTPFLPADQREKHRVFENKLAHPPRMWSTHPGNADREANAKRIYLTAEDDARDAWLLFDDAEALQVQITQKMMPVNDAVIDEIENSLKNLDEQYARTYLQQRYRGAYLGRSITRQAEKASELYDDNYTTQDLMTDLRTLYPTTLSESLDTLKTLEEEKSLLEGVKNKTLKISGETCQHRGKALRRQDLPEAIQTVTEELIAAREAVEFHDRQVRTVHMHAAQRIGHGWPEYLQALARVLHYADHADANLRDAQGFLNNVVAVVTADGKVSKRELIRVLKAANVAYIALSGVYDQAGNIQLDSELSEALGQESWQEKLGEFELLAPNEKNINQWMQIFPSWVGATTAALTSLKITVLECLLKSEARVAQCILASQPVEQAPSPTRVVTDYPVLLPGQERKRQTRLDLWDSFMTASGFFPALARFVVAGSIVGATLIAETLIGQVNISVYNGLAHDVDVNFNGQKLRVPAISAAQIRLPAGEHLQVATTTAEGVPVEAFETDAHVAFSHYVYNVAYASPLVEWTAVYGNAPKTEAFSLGAVRWTNSKADVYFEAPPTSVRTKGGSATREVLSGFANRAPIDMLKMLDSETEKTAMILAHARWDYADAANTLTWNRLAARQENFNDILKARMQDNETDAVALQMELETASPKKRAEICRYRQDVARKSPENFTMKKAAQACGV